MGSQPRRSDSITATGYPLSNGSCSIPAWGVGKQHPCRQSVLKHPHPSPAGWIPQFRTTARPPGCRKNFFVGCLMSRSSSSRELCRVQRKESSEGACCPPPVAPPLPGYLWVGLRRRENVVGRQLQVCQRPNFLSNAPQQ